MRELTPEEQAELARRQQQFEPFLEERMPVLTDFISALELPDAALVLVDADQFLHPLSQCVQYEEIAAADRTWLLTRLGYFIGEWLVQRFGGCWFLDEIPESRYFLHYVVGQFTQLANRQTMLDPFQVAADLVDTPAPRELAQLLDEIESELKGMQP